MHGRQERRCPDCGGYQFVEDHSAGDVVCKGCGLVVEAHIIDERSEWRTFSDKDKEGADPNRVGGPSNPLLGGSALTTMIGKLPGGDAAGTYALQRLHARSNNPERTLANAFKEIADLCERLSLQDNIRDKACAICKDVTEYKNMKSRGARPLYAACIYVACRQEGVPRTFKEIYAAVPDVAKKDIARSYQDIFQMLRDQAQAKLGDSTVTAAARLAPGVHPADYMRRWCSQLGMTQQESRACVEAAERAMPREERLDVGPQAHHAWSGKSPISIASAIIFTIAQLQSKKRAKAQAAAGGGAAAGGNAQAGSQPEDIGLQDITIISGVALTTIMALYRDMYNSLDEIVPSWYAGPELLLQLMPPAEKPGRAAAVAAEKAAARGASPAPAAAAAPAKRKE